MEQDVYEDRNAARRRSRFPALAWAFALTIALVGGVIAAGLPDEEPGAVREVVRMQLQAMAADDARRAFDLNDPEVRSQFGDPEDFMTMVRNEYPMVRQPARIEFMAPAADGSKAFQRVRLTDGDGTVWVLTYLLSRQQDRQWRISACLVAPERSAAMV